MKFGGGLFSEFPKWGGLFVDFPKNNIVTGKDDILRARFAYIRAIYH